MTNKEFNQRVQDLLETVTNMNFESTFVLMTRLDHLTLKYNMSQLVDYSKSELVNFDEVDSSDFGRMDDHALKILEETESMIESSQIKEFIYSRKVNPRMKTISKLPIFELNSKDTLELLKSISNKYDNVTLDILKILNTNADMILIKFKTHYLSTTRLNSEAIDNASGDDDFYFYTLDISELTMEEAKNTYIGTSIQLIIE